MAHEVLLVHVPTPCCRLEGSWRVELNMVTPAERLPEPSSRRMSGALEFSGRYAGDARYADVASLVRTAAGRPRSTRADVLIGGALRLGVRMAFAGQRTALLALGGRYHLRNASVAYRSRHYGAS